MLNMHLCAIYIPNYPVDEKLYQFSRWRKMLSAVCLSYRQSFLKYTYLLFAQPYNAGILFQQVINEKLCILRCYT